MVAEMKPVGPTEILLAERIVSLWWRLERAERIQNQAIDVMIERDEPSPLSKRMHNWLPKDLQEIDYDTRGAGPELVLGRAIIKDYSYSRVLDRMLMYERRIENSLHKTTRELERRQIIRQYQQQEAEQQFEPALQDKNSTPKAGQKGDLKKQSQFVPGQNGATSYTKGDYNKIPLCGAQENKANQTQFQAIASPEKIGKREKSLTAANQLTG